MMTQNDLKHLFETQGNLQRKIFKIHPGDMEDREVVDYIAKMVLEATDELHEILHEMYGWKGHHVDAPVINKDQAAREARDVLQYVINIMLACGWDEGRLMSEYEAKIRVNYARANGIGGEKCVQCNRGLDDPGAVEACAYNPCYIKG